MSNFKIGMIGWDHREAGPYELDLNTQLNKFGVFAKYVNTGDDSYVLVFSKEPLIQGEVDKLYHKECE